MYDKQNWCLPRYRVDVTDDCDAKKGKTSGDIEWEIWILHETLNNNAPCVARCLTIDAKWLSFVIFATTVGADVKPDALWVVVWTLQTLSW